MYKVEGNFFLYIHAHNYTPEMLSSRSSFTHHMSSLLPVLPVTYVRLCITLGGRESPGYLTLFTSQSKQLRLYLISEVKKDILINPMH